MRTMQDRNRAKAAQVHLRVTRALLKQCDNSGAEGKPRGLGATRGSTMTFINILFGFRLHRSDRLGFAIPVRMA